MYDIEITWPDRKGQTFSVNSRAIHKILGSYYISHKAIKGVGSIMTNMWSSQVLLGTIMGCVEFD